MEENTLTLQALVIAHACFGHNSFFKGNYLFQTWTDASAIVNYLLFAKRYVADCEERYGVRRVEELLDACHALMNYGVDRYRRPNPISPDEEQARQAEREEYLQQQVNDLWRTIPKSESSARRQNRLGFRTSRRRTFSTLSRRTRRCSSHGSVKSCGSFARSRSISTPSVRPRS